MFNKETLHNPENEPPSNETSSKVEESEMEKSKMPRRRIAGKRTVEEDAHVSAKKERIECTDLSLAWKHRRWTLNQKCDCKCEGTGQLLTTKLTRARGRVSRVTDGSVVSSLRRNKKS